MRWVSIATFIGAALLPAASARPPCGPNRPTTTSTSAITTATATTSTVIETMSTDTTTARETSTVTSAASAFTSTFETTVTKSGTTTLESTTLIPSTTATETNANTMTDTTSVITTSVITTSTETVTTTIEAATTITEAAEPSNYLRNGDFETVPNTDWQVSAGEIKDDVSKSRSPTHYAQLNIDSENSGQIPYLFQIASGLSTERRYRLEVYSTVFSSPVPISGTNCKISATHSGFPTDEFDIDFDTLDAYQPYIFEFTPIASTISISVNVRCDPSDDFLFSSGFDDISLMDIGPNPII
ncbi:hypothetical protein FGADI_5434 [Fusarium gaditjirri]|uniref:CBM-cenC domain-containing protein n=1 Tax=Fusarium gaditjirri TaxID=282569 RepID=A0A8H4TAF0_9HYPO|nr:hypothetical protein FGADI_5434 [Fusarium gaditjirri]